MNVVKKRINVVAVRTLEISIIRKLNYFIYIYVYMCIQKGFIISFSTIRMLLLLYQNSY